MEPDYAKAKAGTLLTLEFAVKCFESVLQDEFSLACDYKLHILRQSLASPYMDL